MSIQTNGVRLLDLNNALASATGNPQDVLRELGQAKSSGSSHRLGISRGLVENGAPIFLGHLILRAKRTCLRGLVTH
ncbi:hypothetical protein BJS_00718 [Bradyrhizobium japonicum SEMIA 5079]|nr:hypothetical protein BJS_00718 [Bradyrhizobium japonicum SEMIA 5079]